MNVEQARFNMVEQQIRPWNIFDPRLLALLGRVPREDFVPAAHKALAFADLALPLPGGQAMLPPKVQARIVQDLAIQPHETVLEIGTGTGYLTALLAHFAQRVISLELQAELVAQARQNLQKAGVLNAEVRQADGARGTPAEAPFDVIVLSGSVHEVPAHLLNCLKPGGRLFAIVGDEPVMRATVVTRTGEQTFQSAQNWDTVAPRLENFQQPTRFHF